MKATATTRDDARQAEARPRSSGAGSARPHAPGAAALLAFAVALALHVGPAVADSDGAADSANVRSRERPALDAAGVRVSSFLVYPRLRMTTTLDDNVFAGADDRVSDRIATVAPQVEARSGWGRHALNLRASTTLARYADQPGEDYDDSHVGAEGRIDISRQSRLLASIGRAREHERRDSPDDARGLEPTRYVTNAAAASFVHDAGKWTYSVGTSLRGYDYSDVLAAGGHIDNQDDRDRDERSWTAEVRYDLTNVSAVFVGFTADSRHYDRRVDDNGFARSSDGGRLVVGTAVDLSGKTSGEAFIGYEQRRYDDPAGVVPVLEEVQPRFPSTHDLSFGARAEWSPTGLTTLRGVLERNTRETTQGSASGYLETYGAIQADHELMRNLIVSLGVHAARDGYRETDRHDERKGYQLGARYLANRSLQVVLDYRRYTRRSDGTEDFGRDYRDRAVSLELLLQR